MAVEAARDVEADCIVRSAHKERHEELTMAAMNSQLSDIPTVVVYPDDVTGWISSTFVRASAATGRIGDVRAAVPPAVADALAARTPARSDG
jgi:phosphopantetheine adenylyltransferase